MDVRIREATPADAEAIARVHVETWQVAYRGIVADEILDGLSVVRRAQGWREWWSSGEVAKQALFVAEADGPVIGFANAGSSRDADASDDTGEIRAIYVLADYWDIGAGRALMDRGLEALAKRYRRATLWVLERNERGRRFYDRGGWQADGASQALESLGGLIEVRYRIDL
jgi:ribosomal protein S18 acetylase RimI-like enzyme